MFLLNQHNPHILRPVGRRGDRGRVPMRIALFSEAYLPMVNGVAVAVATLRQELERLGHEVCVFAPMYPGHTDNATGIVRCPSLSLPTNPRYPIGFPFVFPHVWRAVRKFQPDVIHSHSLFGMGRVAARMARRLDLPLIFTYHTLIEAYTHYIPFPQPVVRWMARRESRRFSNRADLVVAPGHAACEALFSYGVRSPIEVIPTGIDLSLAEKHAEPLQKCWGIPEGAPVVAFTGRIAREKNIELLIEAFAIVAQRIPDAHLVMIGSGPWQDQMLRMAERSGLGDRTHVTGFLARETVFDILKQCCIFAFPSITDTQGIAVLEAMSCGLPAIAARSAAIEGVLRHMSEGLVVEPKADAFGNALACLLSDASERERMGTAARMRAREFSAATCAERVVAAYTRVQTLRQTAAKARQEVNRRGRNGGEQRA